MEGMGAAAPRWGLGGVPWGPFAAWNPAAVKQQREAVIFPELHVGRCMGYPGAQHCSSSEEQLAEEHRVQAPPKSDALCTRTVQGLAQSSSSLEKKTQALPRVGWPGRDEGARRVWCQVRAQHPGPPPPRHTSWLYCTQVAPGQILATKMPVSFQFGL